MIYPLATLAPTVDSTGISAPPYSDILLSLQASYQGVYGSDIYIAPDSQDGQAIAIEAKAINDSNNAAIAVFQSFSPTYAQGAGLSSLVKINGLTRNTSGYSTAVGNVIGVAGAVITNGVVQDAAGNKWNLPASVTIPVGGSISVTVTAQLPGAIVAAAGTINKIANPQYQWQSFTSTSDAVVGAPVEQDPTLKGRQAISTALPSQTVLDGILAAVGNVAGVTRFTAIDNDTASADVNGIPAHTISIVVQGGTVSDVANAIALKKTPGGQTYGTTSLVVTDALGIPRTINYFQLATVNIYFAITIKALTGYTSATGTAIQNALLNFINSLAIGEDVYYSQAQAAASLISLGAGQTFYIVSFYQATTPAPVSTSNIVIAFNAAAQTSLASISLTVT